MNYSKKYQNTISTALEATSDVLLSKVNLEFEVRSSDYINMAARKGHLESSQVVLMFDRASLVDLLMTGDLHKSAQVKI